MSECLPCIPEIISESFSVKQQTGASDTKYSQKIIDINPSDKFGQENSRLDKIDCDRSSGTIDTWSRSHIKMGYTVNILVKYALSRYP